MNLEIFHPAVARWFGKTFPDATPPQQDAWPAIKQGRNTLIAAPTGSGKTLAAFLAAIDDLVRLGVDGKLVVLGASPEPIQVPPVLLITGRRSISGWPSGTSADSEDTLKFSVMANVRPMIEKYPLERAAEGYARMLEGKARFRVVLTPHG